MTRLLIVTDPYQPSNWEDVECEDVREALAERFTQWPEHGRIYNLAGVGDTKRFVSMAMAGGLQSRDVTPRTEGDVERLGGLPGPLVAVVPPQDPVTIIIGIIIAVLAVAATLLLMPKVPELDGGDVRSPNNSLSQRSNRPRTGDRIPDIFGAVRSTPDLLAVPYRQFVNNLEVEISYMCVGRGEYEIEDVRDGDTLLEKLAGSGASFYAPDTSPNLGVPQLQIGSDIDDPLYSVVSINEVNDQTLRPANAGFAKGSSSIRFTSPNIIETTDVDMDFTDHFEDGDDLTIGGADFGGGAALLDAHVEDARFYADGKVEFATFDPTTKYEVGMNLAMSNAGFAGDDGAGGIIYIDVSGTYPILDVQPTYMMLDIT